MLPAGRQPRSLDHRASRTLSTPSHHESPVIQPNVSGWLRELWSSEQPVSDMVAVRPARAADPQAHPQLELRRARARGAGTDAGEVAVHQVGAGTTPDAKTWDVGAWR